MEVWVHGHKGRKPESPRTNGCSWAKKEQDRISENFSMSKAWSRSGGRQTRGPRTKQLPVASSTKHGYTTTYFSARSYSTHTLVRPGAGSTQDTRTREIPKIHRCQNRQGIHKQPKRSHTYALSPPYAASTRNKRGSCASHRPRDSAAEAEPTRPDSAHARTGSTPQVANTFLLRVSWQRELGTRRNRAKSRRLGTA